MAHAQDSISQDFAQPGLQVLRDTNREDFVNGFLLPGAADRYSLYHVRSEAAIWFANRRVWISPR
jgi:hypothetical protein